MPRLRDFGVKREKHGEAKLQTPEYRAWLHMMNRCYWPGNTNYRYYISKGITVCREWRNSYLAFLGYVGRRPSPHYSLGRIDGTKNYEPGNVAWQTQEEQHSNLSSNVWIVREGRTLRRSEWLKERGILPNTFFHRIYSGWSEDDALDMPPLPNEISRKVGLAMKNRTPPEQPSL